MKRTRILEPITLLDESINEKFSLLQSTIEQKHYEKSTSHENFLDELHLTETDYIKLIQITLTQPMVFLQRKPSEIWNNSFSFNMPHLWNANTCAQYVLNAYAATSYCSSYMTKVDRSMTNAFKRIRQEHEKRKIDAIQMIQSLGNAFLNLQQISAQQAIHIALSLPLHHSLRECSFINTALAYEQTFILKPTILLKQIPDNFEDVMCSSIIYYYINRPTIAICSIRKH